MFLLFVRFFMYQQRDIFDSVIFCFVHSSYLFRTSIAVSEFFQAYADFVNDVQDINLHLAGYFRFYEQFKKWF